MPVNNSTFDEHQNLNKNAMESASATVKSALLINGGAAVAVLGFASKFAELSVDGSGPLELISGSLLHFAWGVTLATLAFATSYFTNYCLAASFGRSRNWRYANIIFHVCSIALVLASIGLFLRGAYSVRSAVALF